MKSHRGVPLLLLGALLVGACNPEPAPIRIGEDACATCLMGIADVRFAAEAVSRTGKTHMFDSAECLASFTIRSDDPMHSLWVSDFGDPPSLIRVEDAYFLISPTLASPMGLGVSAYGRVEDRDGAVNAFGGRPAIWVEVLDHVRAEWPDGTPHSGRHGWQEGPR